MDYDLYKKGPLQDDLYNALTGVYDDATIHGISPYNFNRKYITFSPLPATNSPHVDFKSSVRTLIWKYWTKDKAPSRLSFPMLSMLTELIVRLSSPLKNALQHTYAYVFLDEFQDTTIVQYNLFKTIFEHSGSRLIAVGDEKQRIMGFADALSDNFKRFEADFSPIQLPLLYNFRSAPELVRIQMNIASAIQSCGHIIESQKEDKGVCRAVLFDDENTEAKFIAGEIIKLIESGTEPRDIAILMRQRSTLSVMPIVQKHLIASNIFIRNEELFQDLLKEPVIQLIMSTIRLIFNLRSCEAWDNLIDYLINLSNSWDDEDAVLQESKLTSFLDKQRRNYRTSLLTIAEFETLLSCILFFLDEGCLKATFPQYEQGTCLEEVTKAFSKLFKESITTTDSILAALSAFVGENTIPVMTMHKSKGLEFSTVFYVGLDDKSLWGYRNNPLEETCGFFVAFSRAENNIIFTAVLERAGEACPRDQIKPLYDLLENSGVGIEDYTTDIFA